MFVRTKKSLLLILLACSVGIAAAKEAPGEHPSGSRPYAFEANHGQVDHDVRFIARGRGYTLFLTESGAVFRLLGTSEVAEVEPVDGGQGMVESVLRMRLVGASAQAPTEGEERLSGRVNYFVGNDPARWRTNLPTFGRVRYSEVYPGIDMVYYGVAGELEFDFEVAPGVDPDLIRFRLDGSDSVALDEEGRLVLTLGTQEMVLRAPVIYQEGGLGEDGRTEVAGNFRLHDEHEVSFEVGSYDRGRELIIDPVLEYSSYLGGGGQDVGDGIAVDSQRNAYVAGFTASVDFPTEGPIQGALAGPQRDAFVSKVSADGSTLIYSTYLGGEDSGDRAYDIAVDADGNAYIAGETSSADFPTTVGAFQTVHAGLVDAFVAKINPAGDGLVYSTFIGGARNDQGFGIAVDTAGYAFVTGQTSSNEYPVTAGAFQVAHSVTTPIFDAFVSKLSADGSRLMYSTYLGGADDDDRGASIAVDSAGNAYVGGEAQSDDFPTTPGSFQPGLRGGADAFVTKVNAAGSDLVYSTYLGGDNVDYGYALTIDFENSAYITGQTTSREFPTTTGAFQTEKQSSMPDSFVTKFNAAGAELVYSTYLGGGGGDHGHGIAVDYGKNAYVTGWTTSNDFPLLEPLDMTEEDGDAFFIVLNHLGTAPLFSTLLGGADTERVGDSGGALGGNHIALDDQCKMYGTGFTEATDFPTAGPFQGTLGGDDDAFVSKIDPTVINGLPRIGCRAVLVAPLAPIIQKLSPNTLFTVFGPDFAAPGTSADGGEIDTEGRLATLFANTCLDVDGQRSPIFQVRPGQVSGQAPDDIVPGYVPVRVVRDCGTENEVASPPEFVHVEEATPEFFVHFSTLNQDGNGLIIAQRLPGFELIGDPAVLPGAVGGAIPGDAVVAYGTGWGLTVPAFEAGVLVGMAAEVPGERSVRIGDVEVPAEDIFYIGVTPGAAGLYQVAFRVPAGLAPGIYTVVVTVDGVSTPLGPFLLVGDA